LIDTLNRKLLDYSNKIASFQDESKGNLIKVIRGKVREIKRDQISG